LKREKRVNEKEGKGYGNSIREKCFVYEVKGKGDIFMREI